MLKNVNQAGKNIRKAEQIVAIGNMVPKDRSCRTVIFVQGSPSSWVTVKGVS